MLHFPRTFSFQQCNRRPEPVRRPGFDQGSDHQICTDIGRFNRLHELAVAVIDIQMTSGLIFLINAISSPMRVTESVGLV